MDTSLLFVALGLVPFFTVRAFVPLFATALLARVGPELGPLADLAGIQLLAAVPDWATSDPALVVLGGFALIEVLLQKSPEFREWLSLTDAQLKALAALVMVVVLSQSAGVEELGEQAARLGADALRLGEVAVRLGADVLRLGEVAVRAGADALRLGELATWSGPDAPRFGGELVRAGVLDELRLAHVLAVGVGALTWFLATLRGHIFGALVEMDPDDDLGLLRFLSWLEDAIGFLGVIFVVVLPIAAVIVTGLTLLALWSTRSYLERRDDAKREPCPECEFSNPLCGLHCARCGRERFEVMAIGILGTVKGHLAVDRDAHMRKLHTKKRCRRCGERLAGSGVDVSCRVCGLSAFRSRRELEAYVRDVGLEMPKALAVLAAFGAIPVIGLVPGMIYYRLSIVASLRRYTRTSGRLLARVGVRIAALILIVLQPIPVVGAATLPLLGLVSFAVNRKMLSNEAKWLPSEGAPEDRQLSDAPEVPNEAG